jgi:WD40 repeat protein
VDAAQPPNESPEDESPLERRDASQESEHLEDLAAEPGRSLGMVILSLPLMLMPNTLMTLLLPRSALGTAFVAAVPGICALVFVALSTGGADHFALRGNVIAFAFSPDGRSLAVSRSRGRLEIWDLETGSLQTEHASAAGDHIAFTDSSDTLIVVRGLRLLEWNLKTDPLPIRALDGQRGSISALSVSRGRSALATADTSGTVIVWDAETFEQQASIHLPAKAMRAFDISPDAGSVLLAPHGRTPQLWDIESGEVRKRFSRLRGSVRALTISPDGRRLAASADDRTVAVWNIGSAKPAATRAERFVSIIAFHPDCKRIACVSGTTIEIWDPETNHVQPMDDRLQLHYTKIAFSPDGKLLAATADENSELLLFDVDSGRIVHALDVK